jgi:hypothetical protein
MTNRAVEIFNWMKDKQGYTPTAYEHPYSFFEKEGRAVGVCITCGIVVIGAAGMKTESMERKRWPTRDIKGLKRILYEGVYDK